MNASATPEWLQDNGEKPTNMAPSAASEEEKTEKASRCAFCSCGCIFLVLISLVLCALFIYAAIVQTNDTEPIQWIVLYSFSAAVPAMFLMHYIWCFPPLAIYFVSLVTAVWSIVYFVIMGKEVQSVKSAGEEININLIYDLSGASVVMFNALYHCIMVKCCVRKEKEEITEELEFKETTMSEQV